MKSKPEEDENTLELRELDDAQADTTVDNYKDLKIDILASSRKNFLQWNGLEK